MASTGNKLSKDFPIFDVLVLFLLSSCALLFSSCLRDCPNRRPMQVSFCALRRLLTVVASCGVFTFTENFQVQLTYYPCKLKFSSVAYLRPAV
jgi:hypothetical protein